MIARLLERSWYSRHPLTWLLLPASWLYAAYMLGRRLAYISGLVPVRRVAVPVIVVGNLTVGGTGKTPLVIWLADFLRREGYRPGIVSRGYGGNARHWPQQVRPDSSPDTVGDEPVLIARRTRCPVAVGPRRLVAAETLLEHTECDILVCDDGLQHLGLGRDIEIVVIDGDLRFGNGHCLPAGPLREPVSRLRSVDMVVANGRAARSEFLMEYRMLPLCALDHSSLLDAGELRGREVHAVAGTGNPARFFSWLRSREIHIIKHQFPDHHCYRRSDIDFGDDLAVVMTEKDAVKCEVFAGENMWYLPIEAILPAAFDHRLRNLLREVTRGQETA